MTSAGGREHRYQTALRWTGNRGQGTGSYRAYGREHTIEVAGKAAIRGSSDPAFRGDPGCHNPEELLVAAASACHMLMYLHLCADAGIVVTAYEDAATGVMVEDADGGGRFRAILLTPRITLAPGSDRERARALHAEAHHRCFVANSLSTPISCEPSFTEAAG
ncbi:MAG: OsmC family protein [Rhodospirillales bacterium]|nr:OsmC family protein [Rhodospirillales bacterium]